MPNVNGSLYGLTILSPILNDEKATPSHDLQIRAYLATLPTGADSPFALTAGTHLCRLVVMDDVVYVGMPACEEHLQSKYLIFECNLDATDDAGLERYLRGMAETIPAHLDAVWSHCVGYPGAKNAQAFVEYMKACQIETTFFFAAVNDKSLPESLNALQTQRAVTDFIASHQGMEPARLQAEFVAFAAELQARPVPKPGAPAVQRDIKTGGHNE
ncbi:MAG TPA: hypothetical protein VHZ52_04915 [Acidobacteriaceae bacterium]|jgi:hypothetical protein|nr:hypothetical protein [Acidobacteriaceae bacterium]